MMRRSCIMGILLACACRDTTPPRIVPPGPARNRLPALTLQRVSTDIDASPLYLGTGFRIGPQGFIVTQYEAGDGLLYSLIDTAGVVLRRLGRIGDGPGELRGGGLTDVSDSAILVGDRSHGRIDRFGLDGQLLQSARAREPILPMAATSSRDVLTLVERKDADLPAVASVVDGSVKPLMDAPDSFVTASFPATRMFANGSILAVKRPVIGRWTEGFILADGWDYRLALYGWDGRLRRVLHRDVSPLHLSASRLDRALRAELPFASRHGRLDATDTERLRAEIGARRQPFFPHSIPALGLDGQGRIWVLGIDGDSAFADVFNQNRFLGRIGIPCASFEGGWSINGTWLAVACAPDDPHFDGNAVFKVFHLVD